MTLTVVKAELTRGEESLNIGCIDPEIDFTLHHPGRYASHDLKFSTTNAWDEGRKPTWNESFEIRVDNLEDILDLNVINKNSDWDDQLIGSGTF